MSTHSQEKKKGPFYDRHTRSNNVLHNLLLRHTGLVSPRRAAQQLIRGLYTHGTNLHYAGGKRFKKGHFSHDDLTIVGRLYNNTGDAPQVYSLRDVEPYTSSRTEPANMRGDGLQLSSLFLLPRVQEGLDTKGTSFTVIYQGSGYPYDETIPEEDYRPALLVLSQGVLSRYDNQTYRLLSRHSLAFSGASFNHFEVDYDTDLLIMQSSLKIMAPQDYYSMPYLRVSRFYCPDHFGPIMFSVIATFKLHPFRLQSCFTVSSLHFPSRDDTALYGKMASMQTSATFLLIGTTASYTLFYDFSQFVMEECTGEDMLIVLPGPVLMAVPDSRGLLSLGGQGFFSILFGPSPCSMKLSSTEQLVDLTARMKISLAEEDVEETNQYDQPLWPSDSDQMMRLTEDSPADRTVNARHNRHWRRQNKVDVENRMHSPTFMHRTVWDLLQKEYIFDHDHQINSGVHFFPANFNRLVLTTDLDLRIIQLPPPPYDQDLPFEAEEVMSHSGFVERPLPMGATSFGRPIRQPRTWGIPYRSNRYRITNCFSYTIAHDYNLLFMLVVDVSTLKPCRLRSLVIYDLYTLEHVREIALNIQISLSTMWFDVQIELSVDDDTVVVVCHTLNSHNVYCFKLRNTIAPTSDRTPIQE